MYSRETCSSCNKEYYVDASEPNLFCFRRHNSRCKNDYIKDLVVSTDVKVKIINEIFTT